MTETSKLGLPLLQPAQAQKHVTVNEALVRLDGVTQLVALSRVLGDPPASPADGDCYLVASGAVNGWAGHSDEVAVFSNGGWVFIVPQVGWQMWVADEGVALTLTGAGWVAGLVVSSPAGAGNGFNILEADVDIPAGGAFSPAIATPGPVVVFGVTGIVTTAITGTLTDWQLGASGAPDRYGSGLGIGQGSWLHGVTGSPMTYYSGYTPLLTPVGGDFAAGQVRLSVHYFQMSLPSAI